MKSRMGGAPEGAPRSLAAGRVRVKQSRAPALTPARGPPTLRLDVDGWWCALAPLRDRDEPGGAALQRLGRLRLAPARARRGWVDRPRPHAGRPGHHSA